jgi:hypothetical protein
MLDNIKVNLDFDKLSWYVSISILAFIFSVFSLIYRPEYLRYGLITFIYGVTAHIIDLAFNNICENKKPKPWLILFIIEFILIAIWVYSISR